MTLPVLRHIPISSGYSVDMGVDFRSKQVQGGTSIRRRFALGNPDIINATYRMTTAEYGVFIRKFVEVDLNGGGDPFIAELIVRDVSSRAHEVTIIEGSLRSSNIGANFVDVLVQLEVVRVMPEDIQFYDDLQFLDSLVETGGTLDNLINIFEKTANLDIPRLGDLYE